MGRLVEPSAQVISMFSGANEDKYATRILKYIPAESVAVYLGIQSFMKVPDDQILEFKIWWVFVYSIILVLTPVYIWKLHQKGKPWILQAIFSTVGFVVWSYALHNPNTLSPFAAIYDSNLAGICVILYPFVVGAFSPGDPT